MFCAQRWRNYFISPDVKTFCFTFALLWGTVFTSNFGTIVSGFISCHAPGFQQEAELKYCRFFGNREIAKFPDWERTGWIVYYWVIIAFALIMACWQMFVTFSLLYIPTQS